MSTQAIETVVDKEGASGAGPAEAKERDIKLEQAKAKVEAESKAIARDVAKDQDAAGHKFLKLGQRCHKFMAAAKGAGYSTKEARGMLEADILVATRVDWSKEITRAIRVYHTHCHFGEGVLSMPLDMQKALSTFVREDEKTGEWGLVPRYADAVTKLYNKATSGKKRMTAQEFRAQLNMITRPETPEKVSPAGETQKDLGRPPAETFSQQPESSQTLSAGIGAIKSLELLTRSEQPYIAFNLLGQRIDADHMVEVIAGFVSRLKGEEDRELAAADWKIVWAALEARLPTLAAMFGENPGKRKTA